MTAQAGRAIQYRRRGSAYAAVLGSCMLVATIGLSSIMVAQIHHRTASQSSVLAQARWCAQSIVEAFVGSTYVINNWRTGLGIGSGDSYGPFTIGPGECRVIVVDEIDGDLANDPDHGVRVTGWAQVGDAVYRYSALAEPPPLDCLQKAISAVGLFKIDSGSDILTVSGAPAYCHRGGTAPAGLFWVKGSFNGDVETDTLLNEGTITGSITEGVEDLTLPPSTTPDYYLGLATTITRTAIGGDTITNVILSHERNPYGAVNPDGVYYIDSEGHPINIEDCRIEATLIVELASDKDLDVSKGVYWEPHRSDYPALIVIGGRDVKLRIERPLDEASLGINFNPPGMPYQGQTDSDQVDVYPGMIKGLIHVPSASDEVLLENAMQIEGALIAECSILVKDTVTITYDQNLVLNPPKRYCAPRLVLVDGTWQRVLSP